MVVKFLMKILQIISGFCIINEDLTTMYIIAIIDQLLLLLILYLFLLLVERMQFEDSEILDTYEECKDTVFAIFQPLWNRLNPLRYCQSSIAKQSGEDVGERSQHSYPDLIVYQFSQLQLHL